MGDDCALEGRALRQVVDAWGDPMEHEAQNIGVAVVALADECEAPPKAHDVRLRREVLG